MPIEVISEPNRASLILASMIDVMEIRYKQLTSLNTRNIVTYNHKIKTQNLNITPMKYNVIVIDEMADLMLTAPKETEKSIIRLVAKARAVGIHLILATQRPSVKVITGLIKANMPARISFKVASGIDSRVILESNGAELLLGRGDMIINTEQYKGRGHGAFISETELEDIVATIPQITPMSDTTYINNNINRIKEAIQPKEKLNRVALEQLDEAQPKKVLKRDQPLGKAKRTLSIFNRLNKALNMGTAKTKAGKAGRVLNAISAINDAKELGKSNGKKNPFDDINKLFQ